MISIDGIEVTCPVCHADPGYACTSTQFRHLTIRHHDRFLAATRRTHQNTPV